MHPALSSNYHGIQARHTLRRELALGRIAPDIEGPAPPGPRCIRSNQDLTKAPPFAAHSFCEVIEKPLPLHAFKPLQAFDALLQALWPLQALAAMHLPAAALAGVDVVETTAPAKNRVAAATASVAPDLESNFMMISSMIV
jgi:hypothetical protein